MMQFSEVPSKYTDLSKKTTTPKIAKGRTTKSKGRKQTEHVHVLCPEVDFENVFGVGFGVGSCEI